MKLIASGAYLQGEFVSEVGLLPPSFLPIGNKRLYEYQIDFLKRCSTNDDIYLSIPDSYDVDDYDLERLNELDVTVLKVPDGLSLGASLLYSWNATAKHYDTFTLLHGDTLFLNTNYKQKNSLSVHTNRGFYQRASLGKNSETLELVHNDWSNDCDQVISGYFNFEQPLYFMKSLIQSKNDFIPAITTYHKTYSMELVTDGDWLDFGHINSFFYSRTQMTTQRVFNDLKISQRSVYKSSKDNPKKIFAEGNWFAQLPLPLKLHTPALLGLDKGDKNYRNAHYEIEYLYLLPLSDLFVFSRLANGCWQTIFNSILKMLNDFSRFKPSNICNKKLEEIDCLYLPKTLERLTKYSQQQSFSLDKKLYMLPDGNKTSLTNVAITSSKFIKKTTNQDIAISHGDLCFSNLLFDSRVQAVKCIDPRGITLSGEFSNYGDKRYDLAKLYHSVIGLYDFIIAGRFSLKSTRNSTVEINFSKNKKLHDEIDNSFRMSILENSGYSEQEILAITIHLFLSMLPLHQDKPERQEAFIANALRLFNKLEGASL